MITGFIGAGNMGGALIRAASKAVPAGDILICDRNEYKIKALSEECGAVPSDISTVASESDLIFLGVKPQMLSGMLCGIRDILKNRIKPFTLVSMAAGISADTVSKLAGGEYPVIRIMPNLAVGVGEGIILYADNGRVSAAHMSAFLDSMQHAGMLDKIEEKLIDAASAICGCAPAFAFMFAEALADGGVFCGLKREKALAYASQMMSGAAKMLLESKEHPGALKDAVCSPGGSTIAGVKRLEDGAFRSDVTNAVIDSFKRTVELGKV